MELFHEIPDAQAIIRGRGGVHKQTKVYSRAGNIYVAALGGYIRVCAKLGDNWPTANPNLTVIDISQDVPGLFVVDKLHYKPEPKKWS